MKKIIWILLSFVLIACGKKEDEPVLKPVFSPTYIITYMLYTGYEVEQREETKDVLHVIGAWGKFTQISSPDVSAGTLPAGEAAAFRRLAERNGDTGFNKTVCPDWNGCFADNFQEIHVVCTNRDVDAAHPAGSRIDELVIAEIYTCGPYVRNKYTGEEWRMVKKPVAELKEGDMEMISTGSSMSFYFAEGAGLEGEFELEVTLVTTDGATHVVKGIVTLE